MRHPRLIASVAALAFAASAALAQDSPPIAGPDGQTITPPPRTYSAGASAETYTDDELVNRVSDFL
ncbi:MAG: DUF1134 domain-containing protein, partial [Caulobacteraceae bacterium]